MIYPFIHPNIDYAVMPGISLNTKLLPYIIEKMDGSSLDIDTSTLCPDSYFGRKGILSINKSLNASELYANLTTKSLSETERNISIGKIKETDLPVKEITLNDLKQGDIIIAKKYQGTYLHYGVYVGNGEVVHFSYHHGEKIRDTRIIKTSYAEFANGSPTYREPLREGIEPNSGKETAQIAEQMVDNNFGGYNLKDNNCEHFANYCKYNQKESYQIKELAEKFSMPISFDSIVIEHYFNNNIIIPRKYEKIKTM